MNFKSRFKLGLLITIPGFFLVFLLAIVLSTFKVWYPFIDFLGMPKFLYVPLSVVFTLVFVYIIGVSITTKWINWFFTHTPIVKIIWKPIKSISDRLVFAWQGGYKIVMYSGYHNDTKRERPGIVLGKTTRIYGDGTVVTRLIVMQPIPNVFDSLLIPFEDTEVIEGDTKQLLLYMASGGIINPPVIKTRKWTEEEYGEIPQEIPKDITKNGKDNGK